MQLTRLFCVRSIGFCLYLYKSPLSSRYLKLKLERYLLMLYVCWWLLCDRQTPKKGGRPQLWMRTAPLLWPHFRFAATSPSLLPLLTCSIMHCCVQRLLPSAFDSRERVRPD
jgi:hypothetical protein